MVTTSRALPIRTWVGFGIVAAGIGWTIFVLATLGSPEDAYFRGCTGSCLAEMPDNYRLNHALLGFAVIAIPILLVGAAWFFFTWLTKSSD